MKAIFTAWYSTNEGFQSPKPFVCREFLKIGSIMFSSEYLYILYYLALPRFRTLAPWAAWAACDWIAAAVGEAPSNMCKDVRKRAAPRNPFISAPLGSLVHCLTCPRLQPNHNKHRLTTIQWWDWSASLALKKLKMYQDHQRSRLFVSAASVCHSCLQTIYKLALPSLSNPIQSSKNPFGSKDMLHGHTWARCIWHRCPPYSLATPGPSSTALPAKS
jgi:hypothetical protein